MNEATFEIKIPAPLLHYGFNRDTIQQRTIEWLVFSLFTEGCISSGKAARFLNISRVEFLALLRERALPISTTPLRNWPKNLLR